MNDLRHIGEIVREEFELADRCRLCGSHSNLQAHHICPRRIKRCDDDSNLVTLCLDCHNQVHGHNVDLAPVLTPEEQAKCVLLVGSIEGARRVVGHARAPVGGSVIYIIQPEFGGPVKIGFSRVERRGDVMRRVAALEPGCPWPLRLIATLRGTTYDESRLHKRFERYRIHREWFQLEGELELWLRGLAGDLVGPPMPRPDAQVVDLAERRQEAA